MATQPWWSVRLEQWRATWQTQRYKPKAIPKFNGISYRQRDTKNSWWVVLLCLVASTAVSLTIWRISQASYTNPPGQQAINDAAPSAPIIKPTTATKNNGANNGESYTVAKEGQLAVYWIVSEGKQLRAIPITIAQPNQIPNNDPDRFALEQLLSQQPPATKLKNTIPKGTKLLDFRREVTAESKTLRLNLSREFTQGGGSASMQGRLVQLVYTATITNPDAEVYISVAGEPLQNLGGEGVLVNQPMRRQDLSLTF
ncbi:MAG: GerMN domain-containing protein [Pseudanabaena sp. ELA607]|jgi:spore germination protein GerM